MREETMKQMPAPSKELLTHLEKIQRRVGLTGRDRLQWAVAFAQRDLDALTPGEWMDLLMELRVFLASPYPQDFAGIDAALRQLRPRPPRLPLTVIFKPRITEEDAKEIQTAFRDILQQLITSQWGIIEMPPLSIGIYYTHHPERPSRTRVLLEASTPDVTVKARYVLTYLLGAHGELLRQCPEPACRRIFVASRPNQSYCSSRCLSRAGTRTYRQRLKTGRRLARRRRRRRQITTARRRKGGR